MLNNQNNFKELKIPIKEIKYNLMVNLISKNVIMYQMNCIQNIQIFFRMNKINMNKI